MPESTASPATHRTRWVIAAVVAAILAGSLVAWLAVTHHELSQVTVTPQGLRCDGKDVVPRILEDEFGDDPPALTFRARIEPESSCWLSIVVANAGSRAVRLKSVTFPAMMPGDAGSFLLETPEDHVGTKPRELDKLDDDGDAIFDDGQIIGAQEWVTLTYRIGYRADGASCSDGLSGTSNFPVAQVSALGRTSDVVGSVNLVIPTVATDANRDNCS